MVVKSRVSALTSTEVGAHRLWWLKAEFLHLIHRSWSPQTMVVKSRVSTLTSTEVGAHRLWWLKAEFLHLHPQKLEPTDYGG